MKAYKVVNKDLKSCRMMFKPYVKQYGFDKLVDIGLVFKRLYQAERFRKDYDLGYKIFMVECSVLMKCKLITYVWDIKNVREFHNLNCELSEIGKPPEGTYWGFDIRLVKEVKG